MWSAVEDQVLFMLLVRPIILTEFLLLCVCVCVCARVRVCVWSYLGLVSKTKYILFLKGSKL